MNRFLSALLLLAVACSDSTHIIVEVRGQSPDDPNANLLVVVKRADGSSEVMVNESAVSLPATLTVVPEDGRLGSITAEATLTSTDGVLSTSGSIDFVEGAQRTLVLNLGEVVAVDGSMPPMPDAEMPTDAGMPTDAAPMDAGDPSDASTMGCTELEIGAERATAIDTVSLPAFREMTPEILAVASGNQVEYFMRRDGCFGLALTWEKGSSTTHLNLNATVGRLWVTAGGDNVLLQEIELSGSEITAIADGVPFTTDRADRPYNASGAGPVNSPSNGRFAIANFGANFAIHRLRPVAGTPPMWTTSREIDGQFWDVLGSSVLLSNGSTFRYQTVTTDINETTEENVYSGGSATTQALLVGSQTNPFAVLFEPNGNEITFVQRRTSPVRWDNRTPDPLPEGRQVRNNIQRNQYQGSGNHFAILLNGVDGSTVSAVHVTNVTGVPSEAIVELPGATNNSAIASLTDGVAYIDDRGMVRLASR